jgi:hypothetical protein
MDSNGTEQITLEELSEFLFPPESFNLVRREAQYNSPISPLPFKEGPAVESSLVNVNKIDEEASSEDVSDIDSCGNKDDEIRQLKQKENSGFNFHFNSSFKESLPFRDESESESEADPSTIVPSAK